MCALMLQPADMLRRMGSVSYGDGIAKEYLAAVQKFRALRRSCRRRATDGRHFVLATRITEELNRNRNSSSASGVYNLMWTEHSSRSYTPAKINAQQFENMFHIYFILLDMDMQHLIEHFHQLNDNDLPLSKTVLEQKIGRDVLEEVLGVAQLENEELRAAKLEDFYDRFCQTQIEWCPLIFDWRMHSVVTDQIIPYYHMERIEPNRGSRSTANDRAKLYEIHVPEELIGAQLREKLKSTRLLQMLQRDIDMVDNDGRPILHECRYYRFALKEFPKHLKGDFDRERAAFEALRDQNGMIQYYGWYEYKGDSEHTYNIVLEYADFDLHTAFKKESPPISQNEIKGFWEQMMGLSTTLHKIHRLNVDGHEYDFWHGDIKPENILRVENQFKLADPGDGRIRLAHKDNDQPRARVYGGTWTYSSPEKAQYFHGKRSDADSILQNSDVWSLACVFSMAATYVVLGTQGVVIYDRVRKYAHDKSDCEFVTDDFHNGDDVLSEVKSWHDYLRHSTRLTDPYTWRILDMIDEHLLVMPPEKRWHAERVSEELSDLIEHPKVNALEVPDSIVEILQEIDLEAEIAVESSVNINRVDSDMVKRHIQEERQLKRAVDETSKSRAELFINTQILPTAQRSEHREELLRKYRGAKTDLPRLVSLPSFESTMSGGRLSLLSITPSGEIIAEETSTPVPQAEDILQPLPEHPMTMWEMEDELESKAMKTRLTSIRSERRNRPIAAKGRFANDPLENQYTERDIVYLVDNGSTMARHWRNAIHLLRILAWRSLGYDDDGMELYFTDPDTTVNVLPNHQQAVGDFVDAMKQARPKTDVKSARRSRTDIWPQLNRIIMKYVDERRKSGKERKKTIIILTDGVWEDMTGEYDLDDSIKHLFRQLANQHKGDRTAMSPQEGPFQEETDQQILERIRPVTIQFVAFGQDKTGLERMKRLDDRIGDGWPDLIDMEPANGCVYKMFLGSLIPDWDKRVNRVNSMVLTPIRTAPDTPLLSAPPGNGSRSRASSNATTRLPSTSDPTPVTPAKKHPSLSRAQQSEPRFSWSSGSPASNGHSRHASADIGPTEQDWSRQSESKSP